MFDLRPVAACVPGRPRWCRWFRGRTTGRACARLVPATWIALSLAVPGYAGPAHEGSGDVAPPFRTLFALEGARSPVDTAWSRLFARAVSGTAQDIRDYATIASAARAAAPAAAADPVAPGSTAGPSITWAPLLRQTFGFLFVQQAYRAAFERYTWEETLRGPFWDDYFTAAGNLCCWDDGDKWTTNWLFHPLLGSAAAFVFANNHRDSMTTPPGASGRYWSAKAKQGIYATAYSAYFEVGPVLSESAIGNVGLGGEGQTWSDMVITPAAGLAVSVGEDFLRAHVIDRIDRANHFWGATAALFLNPTRSFANLVALKTPWADPPWLSLRRAARANRSESMRPVPSLQTTPTGH